MKSFCFSFLLFFLVLSCSNTQKNASVYDFIPEDASIVLNINSIENLKSSINNSRFLDVLSATKLSRKISKKLKCLNYIKTPNPLILSFIKDKSDSLQFIFTTKQINNLIDTDSLPNTKTEAFTINSIVGKKITYSKNTIYAIFKDSIAIAASSKSTLKKVLENKNNASALKKMAKTVNKEKVVSVLLNNTSKNSITTLFHSENLNFKNFTDRSAFDVDISQDALLINGITKAKDASKLINIFKNTVPQENQLARIAPNNCDGFISFTFDDILVFKKNLDLFNAKKDTTTLHSLFDNIVEIGVIKQDKNKCLVLNSIDIVASKEALVSETNKAKNYRQVSIYNFSKPDLFETIFYPLVDFNTNHFYCIIDQFIVFGNTIESLENIIANYQNKTTLNSTNYYKNISKHLSSAASLLQILNSKLLKDVLDTNFDDYIEFNFKDYKTSALQFIYDDNYAHFNAAIKKNKAIAETGTVTELLNIKLDANLLNDPQFVINHKTKQKDIVVQDINNKLYLISNRGQVLWKKQLNGPILGDIKQLDIYKNGKLQLAFATPNRVYIKDRTGKDVKGYPLKFKDKITQPLSVFDYDKNKKYRLFVTQDKNILLYDTKGKQIKGFKFSKTKTAINHEPQHIRIKNKDYIIVKTNTKLYLLNRRGKTRIKVKTNLKYSNEAVYYYNNSFTTVTETGNLIQVNTKGKVTTRKLLGKNSNLVTTSKTLVAQNENNLKIKGKTLALDFGNYSKPKLFYIMNKIYVSVTDLQAQKVLLFNSQAKAIANFPVYGNSVITLDNIDKDKKLEFITKGDSDSILLYEIN